MLFPTEKACNYSSDSTSLSMQPPRSKGSRAVSNQQERASHANGKLQLPVFRINSFQLKQGSSLTAASPSARAV